MVQRHEVQFEDLPLLDGEASPQDEMLVHDATDGTEKRISVRNVRGPQSTGGGGQPWHTGTTPPANPQIGDGWFRTTDDVLLIWDGTQWEEQGGAGDITQETFDAEVKARTSGDDFQAVVTASASSYQSGLNAQRSSAQPLAMLIGQDISGSRGGSPYAWKEGDVLTFAPNSDVPERWFNIGSGHIIVVNQPNPVDELTDITIDGVNYAVRDSNSFQGDHIEPQRIASNTALGVAIINHLNSNARRSMLLVMDADVTSTVNHPNLSGGSHTYTYKTGDVVYFVATSGTGQLWFNLPRAIPAYVPPTFSVVQANGLPGITSHADLDGDYVAYDSNTGIAQGIVVNRVLINISMADGTLLGGTTVHEISPWTPTTKLGFAFNVSGTEESESRIQASLRDTPGYVRFALRYMEDNVQKYVKYFNMPVAPGYSQAGGGAELSDARPQDIGGAGTATPGDGTKASRDNHVHEGDGGGGTPLTNQQKAEVIDLRLTPTVVVRGDTAFKTFKVTSDDPSILGSSVWVNPNISGQRTVRQQLTGRELTFTYSDAISATINQNIPAGDRELRVDIELWAAETGGSTIAVLRRDITLQSSAAGGGLNEEAVDRRVQAAKGTATPVNTSKAAAGTEDKWSPVDHDHGIDTSATGVGTVIFSEAPVEPTDANKDHMLYRGKRLYVNALIGKTADFRSTFGDADLKAVWSNATAWGGFVNNLPTTATGTVIYTTFENRNRFEISQGGGGYSVLPENAALAARWSDDHRVADQAHAVQQATAVNQWFEWGNEMYVSTRVSPETHREWVEYERTTPQEVKTDGATANIQINADISEQVEMTLARNIVLTIAGGHDGDSMVVLATQDATGSRTITYGGSAIDGLSTAAGTTDAIAFYRRKGAWVQFGPVLQGAV